MLTVKEQFHYVHSTHYRALVMIYCGAFPNDFFIALCCYWTVNVKSALIARNLSNVTEKVYSAVVT